MPLLCLAVLFPVFILSASFVSRLGEISISQRLLVSGTLTFSLFLLIPLLFARLGGVKLKTGFRLRPPRILACLGAILLGFTLWPFAYELEIMVLSDDRIESLSKLFESLKLELGTVPLWVKLVSLAVLPALCEELFFRGYLLSALLNRVSNKWAILASSLLFAVFHVIVRDSLFIESFLSQLPDGALSGIRECALAECHSRDYAAHDSQWAVTDNRQLSRFVFRMGNQSGKPEAFTNGLAGRIIAAGHCRLLSDSHQ